MPCVDHVSGGEGDDCIWVSGCIVQQLANLAHGVLRGGCMLGGDGAEGSKHCAIDCAAVVEENPEYFLY